jgi:hypothetical protein
LIETQQMQVHVYVSPVKHERLRLLQSHMFTVRLLVDTSQPADSGLILICMVEGPASCEEAHLRLLSRLLALAAALQARQ